MSINDVCKICGYVEKKGIRGNWVLFKICSKCRQKSKDNLDFESAEKYGDITREDSIMCPYCGHVEEDEVYGYDKADEFECPECEKVSGMNVEHKLVFNTYRKEDEST